MYMDGEESVIVLNDGIKFQESSNTSVEMQLNENKKQNDIEICKIFPMPPAVLSGGATEKDWQVYIQYCIMPILSTLVAAINRDMLLEKEKDTYFFAPDVTELTKGDIKTRYDAYKTAISGGFMQVDEVRMKENLPTIGMPFIELGLQNVLYDPISGNIYTPNTNKWVSIKGENVLQTDGDTDKSTTDQKGGNNADTNQS